VWVAWGVIAGEGAASLRWAWRRRRQSRAKAAAAAFTLDEPYVRTALESVRGKTAAACVSRPLGRGYAYMIAQAVPGDDLLVTTGYSRSRNRIDKLARRATAEAARLHGQ
jgi:hypothetical protein